MDFSEIGCLLLIVFFIAGALTSAIGVKKEKISHKSNNLPLLGGTVVVIGFILCVIFIAIEEHGGKSVTKELKNIFLVFLCIVLFIFGLCIPYIFYKKGLNLYKGCAIGMIMAASGIFLFLCFLKVIPIDITIIGILGAAFGAIFIAGMKVKEEDVKTQNEFVLSLFQEFNVPLSNLSSFEFMKAFFVKHGISFDTILGENNLFSLNDLQEKFEYEANQLKVLYTTMPSPHPPDGYKTKLLFKDILSNDEPIKIYFVSSGEDFCVQPKDFALGVSEPISKLKPIFSLECDNTTWQISAEELTYAAFVVCCPTIRQTFCKFATAYKNTLN